ncbi:hypothetical protein GH714_021743 [Hevea brasiliensis]|uniref:MBD domain-containing protein n=1 Tax=Hevea brasiliensis TaxID=3981 RepID=A0A6A6L8P8_HEVBR|nr:hypothetical protein GH714_021743 [Hevea brasiliensis]
MEGSSDEKNLKLMSSTENTRKPQPPWITNWDIRTRQRPNGRIDKYYYHKETNIMCRSLVEVENYELHGILPGQMRRAKKEGENNENPSMMQLGNENPSAASGSGTYNIPNAEMKEEVEKLLKESHENRNNASAVRTSNIPNAEMKEEAENFLKESRENLNNAVAFRTSTIPKAEMKEEVEKFLKKSHENRNNTSAIKSDEQSHKHKEEAEKFLKESRENLVKSDEHRDEHRDEHEQGDEHREEVGRS